MTLFPVKSGKEHGLLSGKDKTEVFKPGFHPFLLNILQNLYFARSSLWRWYVGAVATRAAPKRSEGFGTQAAISTKMDCTGTF